MSELPAALQGFSVRLRPDVPLASRTTLRIGGTARLLAEAGDVAALAAVLRWVHAEGVAWLVLGKGSNLLVPDAGFPGVAIVLTGTLLAIEARPPTIRAGGGASLMALSVAARDAGLSGLEGISGIPSTVGGAVRINAGSYGREIFDVLTRVTLVAPDGAVREVPAAGIRHGYRSTELVASREVVAAAEVALAPAPRSQIEARLAEVRERRWQALPREPNAGSVFKNPPGDHAGRLLEACGLKGLARGGAEVSTRHANVIVNKGGARADDVLWLMARMRAEVLARFGVALEPELELLAEPPWPTVGRPAS